MAIVQWFGLAHPTIARWLHHSPNGGARDARTGGRLKAMGVRRGFPDLVLTIPRHGFCSLAIEVKAPGGRMTPEQWEWLEHLASVGWMAACCTGFDATKRQLEEYVR